MTDDQMRKALDCCCCSDCDKCVLSQYKFDDEYHAKFICMVAESSWRKNLCMALKKNHQGKSRNVSKRTCCAGV